MKKVSSKILAILLSFAVVLSMMPGMAFGEGSSGANSLDNLASGGLDFYTYEGSHSSMLGNSWYEGNELKANQNETTESLQSNSRYLSACVTIPEGKTLSDYTVDWYYGTNYSVTGEGYTKVTVSGPGKGTAGENNQISYYNADSSSWGFYNFIITPDTTNQGTYYYYAVISDGTNTISSATCQAIVIVSPSGSTPPTSTGTINVSFAIEGFGSLSGISERAVTVSGGMTAADFIKNQLTANGYSYEWSNSLGGYLVGVTKNGITYSEFTAGQNSGWMYRVNGIAPQIGMSGYTLQDGDEVVLYYTGDYTKDPYAIAGTPSDDKSPSISITDKDGKDTSSMGSVKYDADSKTVTITPSEGYSVSDVKVNGVSKGAVTKLEGIKATDKIEVVFEAASAEPETPSISENVQKIINGVKATKITSKTSKTKSGIRVTWKKASGYKVSYYQIYRKTGKNGTYRLIYTTKLPTTLKITNVKNLKKGNTYYYKVRGVRVIDGKKYYTKWSNAASNKY